MKNYYRIMLGPKSIYADECRQGNFIGVDFDPITDLSHDLPDNYLEFNQKFIPIWMETNQGKNKTAAGLACGALWTVAKGLKKGDTVLCPDGKGHYHVGDIQEDYSFHPEGNLPHRRTVQWYDATIERAAMSELLRGSTGAPGTAVYLTQYAEEIESFLGRNESQILIAADGSIGNPVVFALERHLEDFLVQNWSQTDLGMTYELIGQQYPSYVGSIDILAVSKDKKEILVVELKKGRASDNVVGQIQRYMGFVKESLAEEGQTVRGVIIALEDDKRIRLALSVTNNIDFYRYQIDFKLHKN